MKKFEIRYRLADEFAYRKVVLEFPDMEFAVQHGYSHAKGIHGVPVVNFQVKPVDIFQVEPINIGDSDSSEIESLKADKHAFSQNAVDLRAEVERLRQNVSDLTVSGHQEYMRCENMRAQISELRQCLESLAYLGTGAAYERAIVALSDSSESSIPTPIPDYMEAACDKFDWTPEEALRFYAEGKHFDTDKGRTRILCTGSIASHALKGMSKEYADFKGSEQ